MTKRFSRLANNVLNFFISGCGNNRDLHSFPTRRSSDLGKSREAAVNRAQQYADQRELASRQSRRIDCELACAPARRSEEHTSELQSRRDLVCRLLLEKKKQG